MAFNFMTAFHRALQDPEAYYSFQKEMNSKAVEQVFFNFYGGKTVFEAVVLPKGLGTTYEPTDKVLRVRPLGIHDFIIPEPCVFEGDLAKINKVLQLHPMAYPDSTMPYNTSESADAGFASGQIVFCRLAEGKSHSLIYERDKRRSGGLTRGFSCVISADGKTSQELKDFFAKGGVTTLTNPAESVANTALNYTQEQVKTIKIGKGSKDLPGFNGGACPGALKNKFSNLPRFEQTYFYTYSRESVIQSIKQNTSLPYYVKATMWVFISIEQPKFNFPNNNPSGIQTDGGMFKGTTISDYDYQTCYRDRVKYRAFAGFNTLTRGMKVFGNILAERYSTRDAWKTFDKNTNIEEAATIVTNNYYTGWNINAKPAELKLLQAGKSFFRGSKEYKRNYASTKKLFKRKLKEFSEL